LYFYLLLPYNSSLHQTIFLGKTKLNNIFQKKENMNEKIYLCAAKAYDDGNLKI